MGNVSPNFPAPKRPDLEGSGGGAAGGDDLLLLWSGRSEGKKGRVGEKSRRGPRILALSRLPAWRDREGHVITGLGICRASGVGATSPLCRAIVCPSPVRTAFFTWWRGRSFWSRHSQWRDRLAL